MYYITYLFRRLLFLLFISKLLKQLNQLNHINPLISQCINVTIIIDIIVIIDIIIVPRSPLCLQLQWLSLHIAGPAQSPRIDKPHPASVPGPLPAHRALPENDCAGGAELFLCHRQELRAVFPRYCRLG
jgi:hypothetical protein